MTTKSKLCLVCGDPVPEKLVQFGRHAFSNVPADVSRCFIHWIDLNLEARKKFLMLNANANTNENNDVLSAWKRSKIITKMTRSWADESDKSDETNIQEDVNLDDNSDECNDDGENQQMNTHIHTRILGALD